MSKTVVGLFDQYDEAQRAADALQAAGFSHSAISVLSNNADSRFGEYRQNNTTAGTGNALSGAAAGVGEGAAIGGLTGLAASLALMMIPGIGPIAAVGPLAATLTGAAWGAVGGGVIGGLTGAGIPEERAGYYAEGIRRGGTLVVVQTSNERADEAADILDRYNPVNVDERANYYRSSGYKGYNQNAPAYTPSQINDERMRYKTPSTRAM